ncbi:hypothetical protein [Colwellia piezophila]|uniref:hypothetical protein n=1 Tax=Colwellia piezophila TaxID=211668 RepID=UPI000379F595|nr:hypothetical protein [Colwellia piezophila]
MSKYKKGYTPEEAALIAVNLESYRTLENAEKYIDDELCLGHTTCVTAEQLNEAMDIIKALKEETWLVHEEESSSCLEIYLPSYNQQFNGIFDPDYSQLTKASLAKWFEEAGEINISKIFKGPVKIVPINHFKQAFTAEHAALIAVGLQYYSSIESALEGRQYQEEELFHAKRVIEQGGEYTDLEVDPKLEGDSIYNATNIKEALLEEIKIGYQNLNFNLVAADFAGIGMNPNAISPSRGTDIVIDCEKYENKDDIKYEETLITKHSVAIWLWNHGYKKYAINVQGNIEEIIQENTNRKNDLAKLINNTSVAIEDGHSAGTDLHKKNTPIMRTPESSLLASLGVMAWLLSKKTSKLQRNDKPNASQIKEIVVTVINDLGLNENTDNKIMFSNLNKDISTALRQLEGRFKL